MPTVKIIRLVDDEGEEIFGLDQRLGQPGERIASGIDVDQNVIDRFEAAEKLMSAMQQELRILYASQQAAANPFPGAFNDGV